MAPEGLGWTCWAPLFLSLLLVQGNMPSLELSCGPGPRQVVLEPNQTLELDCMLGITDQPTNITWWKDDELLLKQEYLRMLPNGSLVITQPRAAHEDMESWDGEGRYSCTSHTALGAVMSRTVLVRSAALSQFLQHPEPQSVAENGLVRFQCRIEGLPAPSITWEKDQRAVPSEPRFLILPNGALQIRNVQEKDAGSYRCLAASVVPARYSNEARLTVIQGSQATTKDVTIVAAPQNTTVVAGQSAVLECAAAANTSPIISWIRQDGESIATDVVVLGEMNLLIPHTQPHHSGVYICRADQPSTQHFVTAEAELRVLAPPFISQYPETISRTRASTARFVCRAEGEPAPIISWLKNGAPLSSNGRVKIRPSGSIAINQIGLEDAGYYQCLAQSSLGTACATARLSVTVREGLPSAPQHVVAVPLSSTSVVVSWQRPEQNSQQIIGFSLHYQKVAGVDNTEYQFAVNNDTLEFHVRDLEPNTQYMFYVVAYSQLGASRMSTSAVVQTWEDVPAAAPQLSLSTTTHGNIQANWAPLSPELSNGRIVKYRVEYCPLQEGNWISSLEVPGNQTQVTLYSLHANQEYKVRIAAGTAVGYGTSSEWTQHRSPDGENQIHVLMAPTDLRVQAQMESLLVTWQPPANHTQISGYKIYYREVANEELTSKSPTEADGDGRWVLGSKRIKKKQKEFEITGLAPGKLYEVKLVAFNKHRDGYAAVWKGQTKRSADSLVKKGLPLPPTHVQAESNSSTSMWLRWKKPEFSRAEITSYTVRCNPWGMKSASLVTYYASTEEALLIGDLKPYTKYEFAIRSDGVGIEGPFGGTVERVTLPDRPATPPSDVQLTATGQTWAQLRWQPPTQPNGVILEYVIVYSCNSTQPEDTWMLLVTGGDILKTDVNGLQSNTRYFFRMGARTIAGSGPYSSVLDVYTLPEKATGPVLDIHSVTGIIVGVCLALFSILFCVCARYRNSKERADAADMDPTSAENPSFYSRARQGAAGQTPCSDCHEMESLMSPRVEDLSLHLSKTPESSEDHRPVRTHLPEESQHSETKNHGGLATGCNQLEADVIVHSNFSASERASVGQCKELEDQAMPAAEEQHSEGCPSAPELLKSSSSSSTGHGNSGDEAGLLLSIDRQTGGWQKPQVKQQLL